MVDYVRLNPGSGGELIASDDINGVQHQRVKVQHGKDGTAIDTSNDYPLPINLPYPAFDAFGRIRVSTPLTIFDSKLLYNKNTLSWDENITNNSGNATSTHSSGNACVNMYVEFDDRIIRQTYQRFNYQPGKSQLFFFTGVLGSGGTGIISRIGAFDDDNGLFFELNENTLYVVERKAGVDTKVARSAWNLNTLQENTRGGVNLNTNKANIFVIDFEWLGVGSVRYGVVFNGEIIYCHQSNHANVVDDVYISTPNLPVRYEISSSFGSSTLKQICCSVISEGGLEEIGYTGTVTNGITQVSIGTSFVALLGIRLKNDRLSSVVKPVSFEIATDGSAKIEWGWFKNPVINGSFVYSGLTDNTNIETAVGINTNTIASGTIPFVGGYVNTQGQGFGKHVYNSPVWLGSSIDGTPDTWVLAARSLSTSEDVVGCINYREL